MRSQRFLLVVLLAVCGAVIYYAGTASAQTTANGPYYAIPSWDQTLTIANRFVVLLNMNSDAVLDRETGLVWQRAPLPEDNSFRRVAYLNCLRATTGGRQGWRLPRADELMSLADPLNSNQGVDHLPAGHPFNLTTRGPYWTSDRTPFDFADGGILMFFDSDQPGALLNTVSSFSFTGAHAWCVRGSGGFGGR